MTESSYFWDDDTIGDGPLSADVSDDEISLINLVMYAYDRTECHVGQYDTTDSHIIDQANGSLFPYISGTDFKIDPGVALVDGRIYETDAIVTLSPASGNGYYAIVLDCDYAAQTVRADLIYNAVAAPTPTQDANNWQVVVAQGQVVGGTPQIDEDMRRPLIPTGLNIPTRLGRRNMEFSVDGSGNVVTSFDATREPDWSSAGQWFPPVHSAAIQCGTVSHTPVGSTALALSVAFPEPFKYGTTPLVFVTPINLSGNTPSHARVIAVYSITHLGFSIHTEDDANIEGFYWVAVCEEPNYATGSRSTP